MSKRRNYRKKIQDDNSDSDEDVVVSRTLEERREVQKFRERTKGLSAAALAFGVQVEEEVEVISDPFKLKTGGLIDMSSVKDRDRDRTGEEGDIDVTNLGSNFSIETNRRDEDVEMLKYIEEEMAKRKGKAKSAEEMSKPSSSKEDILFSVPDHIDVKSNVMRSEEMLSNQMLSGIPEVDLGIHAKIKNIEQTEEAKVKMIAESRKKKRIASDFVPTNMASNFVHHERFFDEKKAIDKERKIAKQKETGKEVSKPKGPVVGDELVANHTASAVVKQLIGHEKGKKREANDERASDDFLYERFRKKARDSWRYQ